MSVSLIGTMIAWPPGSAPDQRDDSIEQDETDDFATIFAGPQPEPAMTIPGPVVALCLDGTAVVTDKASADTTMLLADPEIDQPISTSVEDRAVQVLSADDFAALLSGPGGVERSDVTQKPATLDQPVMTRSANLASNLVLARADHRTDTAQPDVLAPKPAEPGAAIAALPTLGQPLIELARIALPVSQPPKLQPATTRPASEMAGHVAEGPLPAAPHTTQHTLRAAITVQSRPEPPGAVTQLSEQTNAQPVMPDGPVDATSPDPAQTGPQTPAETSRTANTATVATVQTMRQAGHQMATAITQGAGNATEILLDPEELGRVRLSLQPGDMSMVVVIQADRPETADLMRRHIDQLAQEFRSLGYQDVSFSFGQGRDRPRPEPPQGNHHDSGPAAPHEMIAAEPASPARTTAAGHLDLRL